MFLKIKRLIIFIFVLTFIIFLSFGLVTYAHSGGTDSNGGHYDSTTGEYHYHHGYSAHQHINGECPYDFDDGTNENESRDLDLNNPNHVYWTIIITIFIISCLIIVISQLMINEGIKNSLLWLLTILMVAILIIGSTVWLVSSIINLLFKNLDTLKILVLFYDICYFVYSVFSLIISIKKKNHNNFSKEKGRYSADKKPESEERTYEPANSNSHNSSSNNISDIKIPMQKKINKSNKAIVVILSITTAFFGLSTIGLTAGLISIQSDNNHLSEEISDLEASIGVKDDEISRLDREAMNQHGTINSLQNKLNFYDAHVACVNDGDPYYHKPDCLYFDESSFYIYNTETAIVRGYKECPYCYK